MGRRVGVVAVQGAFARHRDALGRLDVETTEVRLPADLADLDAVVLPGGESTTMSMLLDRSGLFDAVAERLAAGMPALGTCAGMILLAAEVLDGRPDQRCFGAVDLTVRRNAYGRQVDSFDVDLPVRGLATPFPASFIRAPVVERAGPDVDVLATYDGRPVLCAAGSVLVASFHPELSADLRIHELFLQEVL